MLTGGLVTYDLSTGSSRITATNLDLSGDTSAFANTAGPPVFDMSGGFPRITVPVLVDFVDLPAVPGGNTSFTVSGTLVAIVPEPTTGSLMALGLGLFGWVGRERGRRSRSESGTVPRPWTISTLTSRIRQARVAMTPCECWGGFTTKEFT